MPLPEVSLDRARSAAADGLARRSRLFEAARGIPALKLLVEDAVEMARPPHRTPSDRAAGDGRTDLDRGAVTERLGEERDEVRTRLANMTRDLRSLFTASLDSNADDEHDPEGQTIAYERAQLSALIQGAQEHLARIEAATLRLQQGGYGICEVCHQPIPAARLQARPTARTCVRHVASVSG